VTGFRWWLAGSLSTYSRPHATLWTALPQPRCGLHGRQVQIDRNYFRRRPWKPPLHYFLSADASVSVKNVTTFIAAAGLRVRSHRGCGAIRRVAAPQSTSGDLRCRAIALRLVNVCCGIGLLRHIASRWGGKYATRSAATQCNALRLRYERTLTHVRGVYCRTGTSNLKTANVRTT